MRQLGEEALDLPASVGPHAPREQPQSIATIALQLAGAPQPDSPQKEQREDAAAASGGSGMGQANRHLLACGKRPLQGGEQTCLPSCCQQEQAASSLLPARLRAGVGLIFSPDRGLVGSLPKWRGPD